MSVRTNAVFRDVRSREVMETLLDLHFPEAASDPIGGRYKIADLTWGKGAFWGDNAPAILGLDIVPRLGCLIRSDSRHVPLRDQCVDVAVFDPPFMHAPSKNTRVGLQADYTRFVNQRIVRALYLATAPELRRIARRGAIVKCSDIVESGKLNLNHAAIIEAYRPVCGLPIDYAILDSGVVRPMRPNQRVLHLRQAHSFFLVYKWASS